MRKFFVLCLCLFTFGCTFYVPIEDVPMTTVTSSKPLTRADMRKAILLAGYELKLNMKEVNNGLIKAEHSARGFTAVMDVFYTDNAFSIKYADSDNLMNDEGMINKNYNRWVRNLKLEIERAVLKNSI